MITNFNIYTLFRHEAAVIKQELSYRKQMARKLTQYFEGIYRPKYYTTTLKSRLRVTQGHWKRNHWIDHTRSRLSSYLTFNIIVTLKCELEVTQGYWKWYHLKAWYGLLFAFHSNYHRIFSHFGDIQRQRMASPWNLVWGPSRSLQMAPFDRPCMIYYLTSNNTLTLKSGLEVT